MYTFALDIGTRKVAGILGELQGEKIKIIDAIVREHQKRAMYDGQIHNIEAVTAIVRSIKSELEERNKIKLSKVTTALAGRDLCIQTATSEIKKKGEITKEDISFIEIDSVRKACEQLTEKQKKEYYCVGYSPVSYIIDGNMIKNPLYQPVHDYLKIETIATFLPRMVFESMLTVLKNSELEIESITLEPIAALSVTIPDDMRLLNLALVDVGAGTSDIAITDKGKIISYGMIPKAGDEITEEICSKFLVDFNTAEKIKRTVSEDKIFESIDIFNNKIFITYNDFVIAIEDKVNEIAKEIADTILQLNKKQPAAVVMVGGGSGLNLLKEKVANNLGLPSNRVGSRTPLNILNLENLPEELHGTEAITPLGILETAIHKRGLGFIDIYLNGEKEHIINLEQEIKVIDVLTNRGIDMRKLYGKPGNALTFTLNGELKIIRGEKAEHAKIFINNDEKDIYSPVKHGDKIFITNAKDGRDASATLEQIITQNDILTISINGDIKNILPEIYVDGKPADIKDKINDRANILIKKPELLKDVLLKAGFSITKIEERDIIITVNNEPITLKQRNCNLKVNGFDVSLDCKVKNMDRIEYKEAPSYYRIRDIIKNIRKTTITVKINGKPYEIEYTNRDIYMNGRKVGEDEFIINGANIEVKMSEIKPMLSSIFKVFPINREQMKGKMLEIKLNGQKAGYTTEIQDGDEIEILFI
ncbi:MAG: rod shape-determining protein [Candidatus Goldbacteria bacterium]|nr:rod shape-determining protein [Candidatus Goldiibacteriota bacterium]